jgi:hypothetical protein
MGMTEIEELKVQTRIAGAELALIERIRWGLAALFAAFLEAAFFHSWEVPVAISVGVVLFAPYWHRKRYDQAWDAYEKATGTGKFATPETETTEK